MRRFVLAAAAIAALLIYISPANAAGSSSYCDGPDIGRFDIPVLKSLFEHKDEPMWQAENRACSLYRRGLIYMLVGNYKNAITAFTYAVGWKSDFSEAYAARGDVYDVLSERKKAEEDYAQASQWGHANAEALNNICWERAKRGYPLDRALAVCNSAIALDSDLWAAWDSRCLVNYRLGNFAAAASDCDKSTELWPTQTGNGAQNLPARLRFLRGLAEIKVGRVDDGNADIAAAKAVYPDVDKKYATFGVTQ